jgi:hypothetical protein
VVGTVFESWWGITRTRTLRASARYATQPQHPASALPYTAAHDQSYQAHHIPPTEASHKSDSSTHSKDYAPIGARSNSHRSHRLLTGWLRCWGWELGACLSSLTAFFAIVGFLRAYEGRPQPHWPYGITLNSAISWLSVLMKGSLLVPAAACISQCVWINLTESDNLRCLETYDAASRGPWGAIGMFWVFKAR